MVCLSAGIIFVLGTIHLMYTFRGSRLTPREPELRKSMERVSPVISEQTTMWKAWVGFNASHSMGAMLFGLVYGYLSVFETRLLFESAFLTTVGLVMLVGLFMLGRRYWFSIPFAGITLSLLCYLAGLIAWKF